MQNNRKSDGDSDCTYSITVMISMITNAVKKSVTDTTITMTVTGVLLEDAKFSKKQKTVIFTWQFPSVHAG